MRKGWDNRLKEDYEKWLSNNPTDKVDCPSDDKLRKLLLDNLEFVRAMSIEEYTLYQKWNEIHTKYPTKETSTLFGVENVMVDAKKKHITDKAKSMVWPGGDYTKLQPELILTDYNRWLTDQWTAVRTFCHTQRNNNNIGRNLFYLVVDKPTGQYLGVVCISSDFIDLTPRDKFVGWTREQRNGGMLGHTAIGSSILPTQPLGFNYVGGKLLALLCLSDTVQNDWKKRYKQILVGMTTTSLYGSFSQYNNLKHWNKRGKTTGKVVFEPNIQNMRACRRWTHKNHSERYWEWWHAKNDKGNKYKRDHKFRMLTFIYSQLGIKNVESMHQRGIYFSHLYENTAEFLRQEITEPMLIKRFPSSTEYFVDLWKEKYASKRIKSLTDSNRLNNNILFYDDLIYMGWEETKQKYLSDVGR